MGYMVFPTKETRDTAANNLKEVCKVTTQDKNIKSVYPKIKISGIPKEKFTKENVDDLRNELIKKNSFIQNSVNENGKMFQVIFLDEKKDSNFSAAIVKVDPEIKQSICKNGNRVFLGLSSCRVTDRYHLIQCYHCQSFGHKKDSENCPMRNSEVGTCLYCAKNHMSRECPVKKKSNEHKCANCLRTGDSKKQSTSVGHSSNSYSCPILQNELKALVNRTMGSSAQTNIPKNAIAT